MKLKRVNFKKLAAMGMMGIAFGFSAHGFALVPVVGSLVADIANGQNVNLPIDAFAVDRFEHLRSDQTA